MKAMALLEEIGRVGGVVTLDGGHVVYEIPAKAKPLIDELRVHKFEIVALLRKREAGGPVGRFGHPHAHLFPLLGRKVRTSAGVGLLWQVFEHETGVLLDRDAQKIVTHFPTDEIEPVSAEL